MSTPERHTQQSEAALLQRFGLADCTSYLRVNDDTHTRQFGYFKGDRLLVAHEEPEDGDEVDVRGRSAEKRRC